MEEVIDKVVIDNRGQKLSEIMEVREGISEILRHGS